MITVKPVTNALVYAPILRKYEDFSGNKTVLLAEENGVNLGHAVISTDDKRLSILKIDVYFYDKKHILDTDSKWVADLLIRAAASYALNRGIFVVYGINQNDFEIYAQLGHKIVGDIALIDLPKLMGKCDNCQK